MCWIQHHCYGLRHLCQKCSVKLCVNLENQKAGNHSFWRPINATIRAPLDNCAEQLYSCTAKQLYCIAAARPHGTRARARLRDAWRLAPSATQRNLTGSLLGDAAWRALALLGSARGDAAQRQLHSSYSSAATAQRSLRWRCSAARAALRAQSSSAFRAQMGLMPCMAPICV